MSLPENHFDTSSLSIQEAARILKVSEKTLRRWEDRGILEPLRTLGGHRRYSYLQLQEFKKHKKAIERGLYTAPVSTSVPYGETAVTPTVVATTSTPIVSAPLVERSSITHSVSTHKQLSLRLPSFHLPTVSFPSLSIADLRPALVTVCCIALLALSSLIVTSTPSVEFAKLQTIALGFRLPRLQAPRFLVLGKKAPESVQMPSVILGSTALEYTRFSLNVDTVLNENFRVAKDATIAGSLTLESGQLLTSVTSASIFPSIAQLITIGSATSTTTVGGDLTIAGNTLSTPGDLVIDPGGGAVLIGDSTPGSIDSAAGDLFVSGDIELDGTLYGPNAQLTTATIGTLSLNGDSFTDLTGTGLLVSNGSLQTSLGTSIASAELEDGSIAAVDIKVSGTAANGALLSYNSATGGFSWGDGASLNLFTDGGDVTYLTATTDDLTIGSTLDLAKLGIDGDSDEIQFLIQGNSTQTANYFVIEASDGTDVLTINSAGSLNLTAGQDLSIGGIGLNDIGSSNTTSGAALIGVYDEFNNSNATTLQDVLDDFDSAMGSGASKWTDSGTLSYLTATTDDVAIGGSTLASSFSVNVASNLVRIGTGATADATLSLYSSTGDTGSLSYNTSDQFVFSGGNVLVSGQLLAGSTPVTLTTATGYLDADALQLISADGTGSTGSASGLEVDTDRIGLLQGCSDGQVLKWNDATSLWECGSDTGASFAVVNVENNDVAVGTNVDTLDFGTEFSLIASPSNEANISIANNAVDLGTQTVGNYVAGLTEGTAIDISGAAGEGWSPTVTFDSTEVGTTIFGANSNFTWTFDGSGATDPTLTFASDALTIAAGATAITGNLDVSGTFNSGTANAFQVDASGNLNTTGTLTAATNETINGIDITTGTVSDVVNLTINAGGDLTIGTIGLNDVGTDNITSGASLVGVFDEFGNSASTTVQDVLDDLDAAITAGAAGDISSVTAGSGLTGGGASGDVTLDIGAGTGISVAADAIAFDFTAALSGDHTLAANESKFGVSGLIFEGATANTIETYFSVADATSADKTITFPDLTGTVLLSGHTFTGDVTATLGASNTTALTIAADSVALGTDTTGNYVANVTGTNGITVTGTAGEGWTAALELASTTAGNGLTLTTGVLDVGAGNGITVATDSVAVDQAYAFVWTSDHSFQQADPTLYFNDTTSAAEDYYISVDADNFVIANNTDVRNDILIEGTGRINIGDNTTGKTIDIAGVSSSAADTVNIATNSTAADVITIGNNNASTTLALTGGDDWSISTAGAIVTASTISAATDETINGIDINTGTVTDVVNLTVNAGGDLTIGTIGLNDVGTTNITSGSSLVGVFDEFTNSNSTTVQDVLDDLDAAITAGAAGDISSVTAGSGLTGGGASGDVTLDIGAGTGISVAADAIAFDFTAALSGDHTLAANESKFGVSGLIFEGATANTIETYFSVADATSADKTITFPDLTGTVLLSGHTFTGDVTATLGASNTTALTIAADSVALGTDTTGNYVAGLTEGTAIDVSGTAGEAWSPTVTFDSTELGTTTFGSGSGVVWTFDVGATDPTFTFASDALTIAATSTGITGNLDVSGTLASGTANAFQVDGSGNISTSGTLAVNGGTATFGSNGTDGSIVVYNELGATDYSVTLQPSASQTGSYSLTLPVDDGTSDYVLTTNGSGVLSWQSVTGIGAGTGDITTVGSMATGDVFTDATADDDWLGLGASAGRIEFDDQATDEVNIIAANVGIGTQTPSSALHVAGATGITIGTDIGSGSSNVPGKLALISNGDNAYSTVFQTGTQTQDVTYTLPTNDGSSNQVLITDGAGVLSWIDVTGIGGAGDITSVVAGSGLTGGGVSGDVTLNIGEGTAIDINADDIAWDSTEVGTTTFGSGSGITWTFDAGATDPTIAFASDSITLTGGTITAAGTLALGSNNLTVTGGTLSTAELLLLDGRSGTLVDSNNVATYATTGVTAGSGLTGGGTVGALTLNIGAGTGISVAADAIAFDFTAALSGDHTLAANESKFGVSGLIFEGATANTIETYFAITDPTASDKTITFPDLSGTVLLSGHTFTGDVTATLDSDNSTGLTIAADSVALGTDTTGNYVAGLTEGTAIDISGSAGEAWSPTVTFDSTELGTTTFGSGSGVTWTFDVGATDPTLAFASDALTITAGSTAVAGNLDVSGTLTSGTGNAFQVDASGNVNTTGTLTAATNETINGIDITTGTVSDVVNLTINAGGDLTIGAIGLNDVGTDNITSGASLVGVFDEFGNSASTTVQDVLDDLDAAITTASAGDISSVTAGSGLTGGGVSGDVTLDIGAGTGISVVADAIAFDFTAALSGDHTLAATESKFGQSGLIFEGATANTIETYLAVTDPTTTDKTITLPDLSGTVLLSGHTFTGDVTATLGASNTTALTIAADSVALGTDTTGNYVAGLTEGTAIDISGTAGEAWSPTVTFDSTELGTTTFGSGSGITWTFDVGATDPTLAFASDALTITAGSTAIAGNLDISGTLTSGTGNAFQVDASGAITAATAETINGIDISSGTVTDVVNLTVNAGGDLTIGTIGLNDVGSDNITSGASLVGVFDEFGNSASTTVQDVLDDLDAAITAGAAGDISSVTAGSGLTGGGVSGDVTLNVGEGTAIDINADDIAWDSTEVGTTTYGSGSGITWTFDAGATDPTIAFGSDTMTLTAGTITTAGTLALGSNNLTITGGTLSTAELLLLDGRSGTLVDSNNVATYATTGVTAGSGLTGGGTVGALTLDIGAGTGIAVNANDIAFDFTAALSGDHTLSANNAKFGQSGLIFEGATTNTIETYFTVTDPTTSDKTITFPDLSGTVLLSGHTFTGDITATLGASNTTALTISSDSVALGTDTTGNYVAGLTEGTAIDVSGTPGEGWSPTVTFDSTELGTTTFGSGSGVVWTFDVGATDPTLTFASDALTITAGSTGITGNLDVSGTLTSGTANAFQVDASGNLNTTGTLTAATNETINGIDITTGTVSDVVNLTINAGGDLTIGTIGLNDVGTDNITSGSSLVGTFDEFANSASTTVQDVLDDLDASITTALAGDISSVTAGSGLTGGGVSGDVTLNIGEGTAIDINADDIAWDSTEVGTTTYGSGSDFTWTLNGSGVTDPTLAAGNNSLTLTAGTITAAGTLALGSNNVTVTGGTLSTAELLLLDGRSGTLVDSNNVATYATTGVTAGSGLTGGGTVGALTLNIGAGTGISVAADAIAFDFTAALSGDHTLAANESKFGVSGLIFEGATANTIETYFSVADATSADKTITFPDLTGTVLLSGHTFTGDVTATLGAANTTALTIASDSVALGTDTTGNYIAGLTEGTAIDVSGSAGEAWSPTVTFDSTELGTTTFGSGSGITWTFDAGATDPTLAFASDALTITAGSTGITGNLDVSGTLISGTANAFQVDASGAITAATAETINGIDINTGTVSDVVNLTINTGGDLTIGAIGLNDVGTDNITSGASLVGVFDEFGNSASTTVQDVLDDLDAAIAGSGGDITSVVAGSGLTGGGITGDVTLNVGEGTAIDINADDIAWDSTEVGTTTYGSGSGFTWTFDAGATDPTLAFASDSMTLTAGAITAAGNLTVSGTTGLTLSGVGGDITFANGEKIDNDTDGTVTITAPTTAVSGDLSVGGGDITTAGGENIDLGEATADTATFYINSVAELALNATNLTAGAAEGNSLGSAAAEWEQLFLGDDNGIAFGLDQDWTLGYDEATDDRLELVTAGTSGMLIQSATATGTGLATTFNALSSGTGLALSSTSTALTSGSLASLDWSPGSATTASGDLFRINIGTNGTTTGNLFDIEDTGSSLFSVSESAITANLPTSFTAAGDVSMAYDLLFTNQTAAYIKSYGPLILQAGESFENNNLSFQTYGTGNAVFDFQGTGDVVINSADPNIILDTKTATDTDFWLGVQEDAGSDDDDLFQIGDGTTPGTNAFLTINTSGNVGIGTTGPDGKLDVLATSGSQLRLTYADGSTYSDLTTDTNGDLTIAPSGGDLTLSGNTTISGTTGLTLSGVGGDITFANGEKIDNDTDGTVTITAPTTAVSGDLSVGGGDITTAGGENIDLGEATADTATFYINSVAELALNATNLTAGAAEGNSLGSAAAEWEQLFLGDDNGIAFGLDQDWTLGYDEATDDRLELVTAGTSGMLIQSATATGTGLALSVNALSSGTGLSLASTSTAFTSGFLANFDWSPGSATSATGDLFRINIGTNGSTSGNLFSVADTASSLFSVSETAITAALPVAFNAPGDVSMAYDLQFTNQTTSSIKSKAPLYIEAGENYESNDLTLRTYNGGDIVADLTGTGNFVVSNTSTSVTGTTATDLNVAGGFITTNDLDTISLLVRNGNTGAITMTNVGTAGAQGDPGVLTVEGAGSSTTAYNLITAYNSLTRSDAASVFRVRADGTVYGEAAFQTTGADLAEYFEKEGDLPTNEVVGINYETGKVRRFQSGDKLLGITSNRAGFVGNYPKGKTDEQIAASYALVGFTGQLDVKLDDQEGSIRPGDPLRPSTQSGRATKANKPGYIIGYALEAWTPGSGDRDVLVYVNPSFADPTMALDNQGQMVADGLAQLASNPEAEANKTLIRSIAASLSEIVESTSNVFTTLIAGTIQSSSIQTDTLTVGGKSLHNLVIDTIAQNGYLVSQSERVDTREASISGILTAAEATISGNLTAKNITEMANRLITAEASISSLLAQDSTISGQQKDELLASLNPEIKLIVSDLLSDSADWNTEASSSADLISADAVFANEYLNVQGTASITNAHINTALIVGSSMAFDKNSINLISDTESTLYVQATGTGTLDLLAGALTLNREGGLVVTTDALFTQDVTVQGQLSTTLIAPESKILGIQLASESGVLSSESGKLAIKSGMTEVASIDASGSATFAKLTLSAPTTASGSATNASTGKAVLKQGQTDVIIYTTQVSSDSLIYITPTSSTNNQVLYVSGKQGQDETTTTVGGFTVTLDQALSKDVEFNWWIIN